jgi:hypothetical protein
MDTHNLPTAEQLELLDLISPELWKPIYAEMLKIKQQREITGSLQIAVMQKA